MVPRRRIPVAAGRAAVAAWRAAVDAGSDVERVTTVTAVRFLLEELSARAPGRSVEVRVPPFGAVQCIEGTTHTRGTPPAVIETDAATWLSLATGALVWSDALADGRLQASGERTDLTALLPLV
ncbi:sterol carrier family protein [Demequina capsici]|uniref:Sterol carrier family protein n=1 Tax=Demequina capsici TaxID=3075620 RepID=A0AA96F7S8_9MICO|nr:sterol carrier family protein [Demequina sp. OYTSA14]WNM24758.1 sterol carrier family protein [Demequina sp. OYTSA14]